MHIRHGLVMRMTLSHQRGWGTKGPTNISNQPMIHHSDYWDALLTCYRGFRLKDWLCKASRVHNRDAPTVRKDYKVLLCALKNKCISIFINLLLLPTLLFYHIKPRWEFLGQFVYVICSRESSINFQQALQLRTCRYSFVPKICH